MSTATFKDSRLEELIREHEKIIPEYKGSVETESMDSNDPFEEKIKNLLFNPRINPIKPVNFTCLQKWKGTVMEINESTFIARLQDLTNTQNPPEIGEFISSDISQEDRNLFRIGAVFYWHIGYLDTLQGQRKRESIIRFQRRARWEEKEIEDARAEADKIGQELGWE